MKHLDLDTNTALALAGLALLAFGIALISIPVAIIVTGGLILIYALLPDRGNAP